MINLIPPAARRVIIREYWTRVVSVWLLLASAAGIMVLILLLPTYLLISIKADVLNQEVAAASEKIASYDISATDILKANRHAQLLLNVQTPVPFYTLINDIEATAGPAIAINDFRFLRQGMNDTIQLAGQASTRQDLASFRDTLDGDERFLSVDLPISNLIKDRDILFSMTINLATSTKP